MGSHGPGQGKPILHWAETRPCFWALAASRIRLSNFEWSKTSKYEIGLWNPPSTALCHQSKPYRNYSIPGSPNLVHTWTATSPNLALIRLCKTLLQLHPTAKNWTNPMSSRQGLSWSDGFYYLQLGMSLETHQTPTTPSSSCFQMLPSPTSWSRCSLRWKVETVTISKNDSTITQL